MIEWGVVWERCVWGLAIGWTLGFLWYFLGFVSASVGRWFEELVR